MVINGFSVLGFCKAVQGLTGFSMRMAHAWGQEWLTILPQTPLREIISLLRASLEQKCVQTSLKMSASGHEFSLRFQRFVTLVSKDTWCDSSLLLSYSINRVISRIAKWLCLKAFTVNAHMLEPASFVRSGSDVLNTAQVWHPNWHLYDRCSFKVEDLWLFSIFCHLLQFSGSFFPQHQS